jgi:prefoldin subunit 5
MAQKTLYELIEDVIQLQQDVAALQTEATTLDTGITNLKNQADAIPIWGGALTDSEIDEICD